MKNLIKALGIITISGIIALLLISCDENGKIGGGGGGIFGSSTINISTPADFNAIRNNLRGNYTLTANISMAGYDNWAPIGTWSDPFRGKLNGNGYKITGLTINRPTEDYIGLFGVIKSGAALNNIALENVSIQGLSEVGGIAGLLESSTINNSYSTGIITAVRGNAGGIAGRINNSGIQNSFSSAVINASNTSGNFGDAGGIAGIIYYSWIANCYSTGNITASSTSGSYGDAGGIAAEAINSDITNSYSRGDITANRGTAGGIVGMTNDSVITNNAAINSNITASTAGRIVGSATDSDIIINNFALDSMITTAFFESLHNGTSKTYTELRTQNTYSYSISSGGLGWNFSNIWRIPQGGGFPVLRWQ